MQTIPLDEITFEPASMVDEAGKVFWWNGEIFRAIRPESKVFFQSILSNNKLHSLYEAGLIPAEETGYTLEGYPLVLKHRRIPHQSYCMEWSSEMLKDAALMMCELSGCLCELGLAIKDAHPWNILFHDGRPFFVDWGSIVPVDKCLSWPYEEFRAWFLYPLFLMSAGKGSIARNYMLDVPALPYPRDIYKLLLGKIHPFKESAYWLNDKRFNHSKSNVTAGFFQALAGFVESIPVSTDTTEWSDYEGADGKYPLHPCDQWPLKNANAYNIIKELQPATLIDIGCNRGWYSELCARQNIQVVSTDIDEKSVNTLYAKTRQHKLPILPVFMDICKPTKPHGLLNAYKGPDKRFQSEMALALALTHHLVFKRLLSFEAVAESLSQYASKWLVVEFVPPTDIHVKNWMNGKFSWYSTENFIQCLSLHFHTVEEVESSPSPRKFLVCTK